jgi:hypothetical protein
MSELTKHQRSLGDEPYPSTPGLYPIGAAAREAGMSAALLEAGIERGEIPAVLRRVGPSNKRFVAIDQLRAWIREKPATTNNLFN